MTNLLFFDIEFMAYPGTKRQRTEPYCPAWKNAGEEQECTYYTPARMKAQTTRPKGSIDIRPPSFAGSSRAQAQ